MVFDKLVASISASPFLFAPMANRYQVGVVVLSGRVKAPVVAVGIARNRAKVTPCLALRGGDGVSRHGKTLPVVCDNAKESKNTKGHKGWPKAIARVLVRKRASFQALG